MAVRDILIEHSETGLLTPLADVGVRVPDEIREEYSMSWVSGDRLTESIILGVLIALNAESESALTHADQKTALANVLDARSIQIASLGEVVSIVSYCRSLSETLKRLRHQLLRFERP